MRYRKKPVIIHAEQYHEGMEDGIRCSLYGRDCDAIIADECPMELRCNYKAPYIETLEGRMNVRSDDYIITGVDGERYPCKKSIFEKTYEKVEGD